MSDLSPIIFLVGATASGKSELALTWARANDGAILSMDAMQVYRGADIGTGKPSAAERAEVPHGGLDLARPGEAFSVATYLAAAAEFLHEQQAAGRRVLVVGGTGLYFRALTRGLCEAPSSDEARQAELGQLSVAELRELLQRVDAPMLERVDASNPRRLARAIAVMEATGKSLAQWQAETPAPLVSNFTAYWLERSKAELDTRIEARVEAMFAVGWVEEVRGLVARHGAEVMRRFPAIGYGNIAAALEGMPTLGTSIGGHREICHRIVTETRQYAKRQLTWFAREPSLISLMAPGLSPVSFTSL